MSKMARKMKRTVTRKRDKEIAREVKQSQVTYTFTNAQLAERDRQKGYEIGKKLEERMIKIFFSMPVMVGKRECGWADEECEYFAEAICDEYKRFFGSGVPVTSEMVDAYVKECQKITGMRYEV